ncbi:hypothetical protein TrispH2_000326 [Trichoplax sp. H2]|uniref:Uncharacterized protein n=1 Tax=Trichoplax adhaerens TaxID=10228 RepID=B3S6B4_TRIAD|nr:predicted protein [Trichoplax adhaerens]EDV21593.1 predicted protein [Trichoplax adhaerens]RDD47340.1 hypothetical protein TrispH2_000326 [Trichoplax sp. H2]|eukprot:XP_002115741.1 predicted protein [Trichoplax adhaerens]
MEVTSSPDKLGKFEDAPPLSKTYCQRISVEEYEQVGEEATRTALKNLVSNLEADSELYKRVLRKRKQESLENSGLFSYVKCKIYSFLNYTEHLQISDEDYHNEIERLKYNIINAFNYAQESKLNKDQRYSRRLIEKKSKDMIEKMIQSSITEIEQKAESSSSSCYQQRESAQVTLKAPLPPPPPPPPPPPLPSAPIMSSTDGNTRNPEKKLGNQSELDKKNEFTTESTKNTSSIESTNLEANKKCPSVDETSLHDSIMSVIKDGSALASLRKTSADDDQIEIKRRRLQQEDNDAMKKFFNEKLIDKFKNVARSPEVSDISNNSGFDDVVNTHNGSWLQ